MLRNEVDSMEKDEQRKRELLKKALELLKRSEISVEEGFSAKIIRESRDKN